MVSLSKRLEMVASMVTKGGCIADVGCDHAYTSIYLIEHKIAEKVIAMDVNKGPLEKATENIRRYGCEDRIETRLSDGVQALSVNEADTVLLSGMGGALMIRILTDGKEVISKVKELILQPQSEISLVRKFLHQIGFQIVDEEMTIEDGKFYTAIHALRGEENYDSELDYVFGRCLLQEKSAVLKKFVEKERAKHEIILSQIEKSGIERNQERYAELKEEQKQLNAAWGFLTGGLHMEKVEVMIMGECKEYPKGITYGELAKEYQSKFENDIILAKFNGNLRELNAALSREGKVEFITTADINGSKTYMRGMVMVLMKAAYEVIGFQKINKVSIEHSLGPGYYGEIEMDGEVTKELLEKIETCMRDIVEKDLSFEKYSIGTAEAIEKFSENHMYDKVRLFRYRRVSKTNIYRLGDYEDYFYGYMPPSTGMLKYFKLYPYDKGFILQLPTIEDTKTVPAFEPREKLFYKMREASNWGKDMHLSCVGELNDVIARSEMSDLILVQEAMLEKKIGEIAEQIASLKDRKFVMIAGPSSSGKTTFSHRLSIQLRTFGLNPHPIALDDYFVNREDTPKNPDGTYNFECLEAIDIEQFNKDMTDLLEGKTVELPNFNFKTGKREYKGKFKTLGPDDILVIEGIHGLNDKLSYTLPKESKFKIYISALTTLNIDEHNQIPTSDGRLIRRMVRDNRTRGTSASKTIQMWRSVRNGEEKYIFPFQESADVMFNSAMIYELAVLKQFAEPILFSIDADDPAYPEAKRLLKFLDYFVGVSSEEVPKNSILREFVGNSYFNV